MRSWLVIPALGAVCAGAGAGLAAVAGVNPVSVPVVIAGCGAAGAAMAACVRALAGDSPASLVGAVLAPLLFVATVFQMGVGVENARALIAVAALAWTVVELARPSTSPLVALLPATVAAVMDPSFVALVPLAGARLMTAPWERPRWAVAVPIAGGLMVLVAIVSGLAAHGRFAALGSEWFGARRAGVSPIDWLAMLVAAVGPFTAVAAVAGGSSVAKPRHAELSIAISLAAAVLVGLRSGSVTVPVVGLVALLAGFAVGRLAGLIRLASGQAIAGTAVAALVLTVPAWSAIEHPAVARTSQASR
ncbi:MAG TPA: hypothetical protein VGM90_39130 [Kofleriaceae bacterium]|jgi:hypothetical protein